MTPEPKAIEVWETIDGAKPLHDIYGYWPTMHDAVVRTVDVGFSSKQIVITTDYRDTTLTAESDVIMTRITLCWHNVQRATLRLNENSLYGMKFQQIGAFIETRFDDYCWGLDGSIICLKIAVLQIRQSPDIPELPQDAPESSTVMFSFGD